MPEDRAGRWTVRLLCAGLVLGAVWAAIRWVLPWAAPFLLAGALAWLLEPLVVLLTVRCRLPRRLAAAACTLGAAGGGLALGALVLRRVWYELTLLAGRLPDLLSAGAELAELAEGWLYRLLVALPPQWRERAVRGVEAAADSLTALPVRLGERLLSLAAGALSALPEAGLFLMTAVLATYFLSAGRPGLAAAAAQLPPRWRGRLDRWRRVAGGAAVCWLRAQGLLMLATFGQVSLGLLLLGAEPAVLRGALTALVDALPILGSGAVLLPWAAWALLTGDGGLGVGLGVLYGAVTLTRSLLEPRLVGRRAGLPSLLALMSMYAGFRALGVVGMILAPVAAAAAWQLWLEQGEERKRGTAPKPPPAEEMPSGQC